MLGEDGAIDVSAILGGGVYLLLLRGEVVYVGKSKVPLVRIYAHRNLARKRLVPWLATVGIVFDEVHVIPCHPDRIDALEQRLISEYSPRGNFQYNAHRHIRSGPLVERRL